MQKRSHEELSRIVDKDHACYVLITCSRPQVDGHMDVEMVYEGDPTLASYLLQGAQNYIEDQEEALIDGAGL